MYNWLHIDIWIFQECLRFLKYLKPFNIGFGWQREREREIWITININIFILLSDNSFVVLRYFNALIISSQKIVWCYVQRDECGESVCGEPSRQYLPYLPFLRWYSFNLNMVCNTSTHWNKSSEPFICVEAVGMSIVCVWLPATAITAITRVLSVYDFTDNTGKLEVENRRPNRSNASQPIRVSYSRRVCL